MQHSASALCLGGLPEGAGRAGEGAEGEQVELVGDLGPGGAGGGLSDADQQQGEPAQDDVGADALLLAMVDRAQVDDLLEVAPAALTMRPSLAAGRSPFTPIVWPGRCLSPASMPTCPHRLPRPSTSYVLSVRKNQA